MLILPTTMWVLPWGTLVAAREAHHGPALLSQHQHPHPAAANTPNKPFPTGTTARYQAVSENGNDLVLAPCSHAIGVSHRTAWVRLGGPGVRSKQAFPIVHHKTHCYCFSRALQHTLIPTGTRETGMVSMHMDSTHLQWAMGASPPETL